MEYEGIAIIGMAGRFPGAATIEEFWANLVAGKETISLLSDAELASSGIDPAAARAAGHYVAARGILDHADCFDAAFFGIHPKEAEAMDPQHRVFLEACWTALEHAGYAPDEMPGSVGVFAGATYNTYFKTVLQQRPDLLDLLGSDQVMLGNEKDYLVTRVAYKLGLQGPALAISTACSTSLVAVAQACQALLTYQCDTALAGGVSVSVPQFRGYYHDEGNIGSADGHTRTFDAQASGTAFGNGVGVVVLKRLEDAVQARDTVIAVIKGAALNNDGSQRVSFGAPGIEGQSRVIALAHALADVEPGTISCVEAHGTATPLGDPVEVAALTKAFRLGTDAKQFCALGSVKTNIGHLDAAAGVTGLIKMALALHHRQIPASLHFTAPNPRLDLGNSPFYVNTALQPWTPPPGVPRRAGVSSFGTGGTNAHVVLEQTPDLTPSGPSRPAQLLLLSAKTPEALDRASANLRDHLTRLTDHREFADLAYTLQTGRSRFRHRRAVVATDPASAAGTLTTLSPQRVFTRHAPPNPGPVVFLFPGQGAQYAGMGADLYRAEPLFRDIVNRGAERLTPVLERDLRDLLFPAPGAEATAAAELAQTRFTQPALFLIEYALARLWMSWGIVPAALLGHSVGEYVAACLAGVFTPDDALLLVARRAALVQALPGGSMLAVRLPEAKLLPRLAPSLAIAALNGPELCVVSGPAKAVAELARQLESEDIGLRPLPTSHAFHSPMMEPVVEPFTEILRQVRFGEPAIPWISNTTARPITTDEARSPEYWAAHVRETVRFADGLSNLFEDPSLAGMTLLEVGPGHSLAGFARRHPAKTPEHTVLSSLPPAGTPEVPGLLETLGQLWMAGHPIDWTAFYAAEQRHRTAAPTYPFERKRCWPEPAPATAPRPAAPAVEPTPVAEAVPSPAAPRKERLLAAVRALVEELSGHDLSGTDPSTGLLETGLDSLLLTQASQLLKRKFGVPVSFRQLMEELSSLDAIAAYLDAALPPEAFTPAAPAPPVATSTAPPGAVTLEQLLARQQQLTSDLLQLMGRSPASPQTTPAQTPALPQSAPASHGPFRPYDRTQETDLTPQQRAALDALIARYTRRTAGSKRLAAQNRPLLADPRTAAGFKPWCKEMVYPLYTDYSEGARVRDVDGNEYIDFVMAFGGNLFGHRPAFVVDAMHRQLDRGFEIGPIHPLAGEVAALVSRLTGMPRVGFTNTGSEAVLAATRIARTVTGRDKIAVFSGAYHGIFDEVLFRAVPGRDGQNRTAPIAPGIAPSALEQVLVLDWANPVSLDILRARGHEIAAVLVEPVQSRRLDVQPQEFLRQLRVVTEQTGAALIFDEVVTGFRLHPGGAQAYFGIRADIAAYGKVMGGGLSLGVVAGDPKYLDALDGGAWQYGDASFPEAGVTFFAGTFVRHPLSLAAAKAVLTHLLEAGPELQAKLTERTARLADDLRAALAEFSAPGEVTQFCSLIQLAFPASHKLAGLFYYLLRERGIHIYENRAFVLTTAHSDADLAQLVLAFRDSLREMCASGFLPGNCPSVPPPETTRDGIREFPLTEFPLTEAQQEIWLAAQMGGEAALGYNESLRLDFRGQFDPARFAEALRLVIDRHPLVLASVATDGQSQRIDRGRRIETTFADLSANNLQIEALLEEEISTPFPLTGPLLRVRVARLAPDHHVAVWTAHHLVCDGWSNGLLLRELGAFYTALGRQELPALEAPAAFEDYVRETASDRPEVREALQWWTREFATLPQPLDLPSDRPRPLVRAGRAATGKLLLDPALHQSLQRLAAAQRTTLVVLLMAAVKTLLHRLTGQTEIVLGLGTAGQAMTGHTCLAGHCVNLLPIRTVLRPEAAFEDNLREVRRKVLDAYDHYQATLGGILRTLRVPRTAGRAPLVEVIFNLDRDAGAAPFGDLAFTCDRNPKRALHFDLFFNFSEGPRGLLLECDYNTDLFDPSTIDRWLQQFTTLLTAVAAQPSLALGRIPLLTETEQRSLTTETRPEATHFPKDRTLHQWFEAQAAATPDAPALTFEGTHLSYRDLNAQANQLAHWLARSGVGPDVLVGLLTDRSPQLVIAILAILKAGGAYLPVDPVYPPERIAFMLEDARVPVVVTQSALLSSLPRHALAPATTVLCLDTEKALLAREPVTNPASTPTPDNLAYAIYTSGSTGRPKGALITHYNVVRLMQSTESLYRFGSQDVWTLFHSHAFDFSVWEIWGALLYGGRLVIVPYLTSRSPAEFCRLLAEQRVTVLNQTPSAFRQLAEAEASLVPAPALALRAVIFGGEALEMQSLRPWFDRHGDGKPRLYNMYGITETTVHVTFRPLSKADVDAPSVIGQPLPDLQLYLLDPLGQPVPVGVTGEIYVGGAGVARGYLRRNELTRARFLPDPFGNQPGALLYRSGDLGRRLANHDIEYCGRLDSQVKIRGFRIELHEIEVALERFPAIAQCTVVALPAPSGGGDKLLAAYFTVRRNDVAPTGGELRTYLSASLPDYMVPSAFVLLDRLPLTANGKIDRQSLPSPDGRQLGTGGQFVAARDPLEQALCHLWAGILKVRRVGVHDNFFALGGHSLLAVRLVIEIEKRYDRRLPLATLLQTPTVAGLAGILRSRNWTPSWSSLVPLRPGGSRPPLFLFHSHGGNVLEYHPLSERLGPDQPVYALQSRGLEAPLVPDVSIEQLAADYLREIRTLQPEGPYFLGGFCFGGLVAFEAAQQLTSAGEKVALLILIQTVHPAAARFREDTNLARRCWYRASKRFDLERENLLFRGPGYLTERWRRVWNFALARLAIAAGRTPDPKSRASLEQILQLLGLEHDKAYETYQPRTYSGDVLLFRAAKQLRGRLADHSLGWAALVRESLDIREIPGHQQNLLVEPHLESLALCLSASLAESQRKYGLVEA